MSVDPTKFGAAEARIEALEGRFDKIEAKVDALLALANQGRGAYWAGLFIATTVGSMLTLAINYIASRGGSIP